MTQHLEPLWRTVAYWLVVIAFFSLPLVVLTVHLLALHYGGFGEAQRGAFSYLWDFHRILAGLLATMLGLNTVDKYLATKNGSGAQT